MAQGFTPMMRQYLELKEQYNDCFLFYRLGDFYEMFFDDAKTVSKLLDLTLTGRDCGLSERAPMCGVPYHSVDGYINRLISMGYKVAICEQMEDPATAKGLVERAVTRIITPGTVIEDKMLDGSKNNYLLCIYFDKEQYGVAYTDVSTGEFRVFELNGAGASAKLLDELTRLAPSEIIANETLYANDIIRKRIASQYYLEKLPDASFRTASCEERLLKHFGVLSLEGFGLAKQRLSISAAGALLKYLEDTQRNSLRHINSIKGDIRSEFMQLDSVTRQNLELTRPLSRDGNNKNTLLGLLSFTQTAMGARMLRSWVDCPLQSVSAIESRLDAQSAILSDAQSQKHLAESLSKVYDIERICSKIAYGTVNGRDCVALLRSLMQIRPIISCCEGLNCEVLRTICMELDCMDDVVFMLDSTISPEPPVNIKDGGLIRTGYNAEVDSLRDIADTSKRWLDELATREREKTGIKTLRIGYNRVFGYYIEVSKSQTSQVPYNYDRKQTLANAERYITPELKEIEQRVLSAGERLFALETELFNQVKEALMKCTERLQHNAALLAELDAYRALVQAAISYNYKRPTINTRGCISITGGRHPIVEHSMKEGFIPNDVLLNMDDDRLLIVTGPNMAGKSTYMRQVALITLMAHIGSYVPADSADICIIDRIFTRIGASDDLSGGRSTFMVEMSEMANILNNASRNSLIILDEIGRGTSTFDGLSIAWAVLEHIADADKCGAKTLFATHFHELSELEGKLEGVKNYRISVKELGDDILFLRKIVRGSGDKSFGIQVAKLAGIPSEVLSRAKELLTDLEASDLAKGRGKSKDDESSKTETTKLVATTAQCAVAKHISELTLDKLSPLDALRTLYELRAVLDEEK